MRHFLWALLALSLSACGASTTTPAQSGLDETLTSPQAQALEASLVEMEGRAETLRGDIDRAQAIVSAHMRPEDISALTHELQTGSTYMEIDDSTILRINGIVMSREDFSLFVSGKGASLCQPTPVLAVSPLADYEFVAWVLDQMYAQSCANIDIVRPG